jgi:pimeloyl-ACP methyl ester carboxylesterase
MGDFPYKDPSTTRYDCPALFIRGTKSRYVPDEVLPLIGQFFPRFRLVDVEAGHWLISENPEAFKQGRLSSSFFRFIKVCTNLQTSLLCIAVVEFLQPQE